LIEVEKAMFWRSPCHANSFSVFWPSQNATWATSGKVISRGLLSLRTQFLHSDHPKMRLR
jgi:hypothetical protein